MPLDRFDDIAWQDWREHSGVEFFDQSAMEAHYRAIEEAIQLKSIPRDHWNRNASLYVEGFEKCGYHWAPLRRGQSRCTRSMTASNAWVAANVIPSRACR